VKIQSAKPKERKYTKNNKKRLQELLILKSPRRQSVSALFDFPDD